ncbi:Protein CBG25913 [Caenorhabditis briggsae]|nr:Protein CBG25913 [Caenorhabditis briggsae]CAR99424.1 Protein CBG25913 [Caenorhabditis briggsae]
MIAVKSSTSSLVVGIVVVGGRVGEDVSARVVWVVSKPVVVVGGGFRTGKYVCQCFYRMLDLSDPLFPGTNL